MTPAQNAALAELYAEGYAIIVWTPKELKGANPRKVEDRSVELGWDVIETLCGYQAEDGDEEDEDD